MLGGFLMSVGQVKTRHSGFWEKTNREDAKTAKIFKGFFASFPRHWPRQGQVCAFHGSINLNRKQVVWLSVS